MATIGTLAWGAKAGGRLSAADHLRLLGQGISAQLADTGQGLAKALGLGKRPELALKDVPLPTGTVVDHVTAASRDASPRWLLEHCFRAYLFGGLLAARDGRKFNPLIFYTACMLHDLGLTQRFAPPAGTCFAVHGAGIAKATALRAGLDAEKCHTVAEAISLHMNVTVPEAMGAEAVLLAAGTGFDVIGRRARDLPGELISEIDAQHPRLGFKKEIAAVIGAHAKESPLTRTGFLCRYIGFLGRVRRAPFPGVTALAV